MRTIISANAGIVPHTPTKHRREVLQFEICKCERSASP